MKVFLPVLVGIGVLIGVAQMINRCIVYYLSSKMMEKLRSDVYSSMVNQPIDYFNQSENSTGKLTSLLAEGMRTINSASLDVYFLLFQGIVGMITGFIISMIYSPNMGIAAAILLPICFFLLYLQAKELKKDVKNQTGFNPHAKTIISDSISSYATMAALANEDVLINRYFKHKTSLCWNIVTGIKTYVFLAISELMVLTSYFLLFWLFAFELQRNKNVADLYIALNAITWGTVSMQIGFINGPSIVSGQQNASKIISIANS